MKVTNIKVNCDTCNQTFKFKPKLIKEEKVTESVIRMYYKCPKCRHKYIVGYKDEEIQKNIEYIQSKVQELKKRNDLTKDEADEFSKEFKELKDRNIELDSRYKAIYGR